MRWWERIVSLGVRPDLPGQGRRGLVAALLAAAAGGLGTLSWVFRRSGAASRGYEEVARWKLPGGEGRFIALDHEPSVRDLRALGGRLRREYREANAAVVMVFDDAEAARAVRRGARGMGEGRFEAALRHQRAMYVKQTARGEERLVIYRQFPEVGEVVSY